MEQRIEKEKARGAKLKQKVQFLSSLNTEDQVGKQNVLGYLSILDLYILNLLLLGTSAFLFLKNKGSVVFVCAVEIKRLSKSAI